LYKEHGSFVATLEYEVLLTFLPVLCDDREMAGTIFREWVIRIRSNALHLDSNNDINSAVVGVSVLVAVMRSLILVAFYGKLLLTSNDSISNHEQAHLI